MDKWIRDDINKSNSKFIELVAPIVVEWMRKDGVASEIKQVEYRDDEISTMLDQKCGIDYLYIYHKIDLVYGIANRIQYGTNWQTFTIRYSRDNGAETEYTKRVKAIKQNGIYPYITVQAYISNNKVAGMAMVRTIDLFNYIGKYGKEEAVIKRTNDYQYGLADFIVCRWDLMKSHGYKVRTYPE